MYYIMKKCQHVVFILSMMLYANKYLICIPYYARCLLLHLLLGPILGILVMAIFGFFSMQGVLFTLETMTRAQIGAKMGMDVKNKGLYYKSIADVSKHAGRGPEAFSDVIRDYDEDSTHLTADRSKNQKYGTGDTVEENKKHKSSSSSTSRSSAKNENSQISPFHADESNSIKVNRRDTSHSHPHEHSLHRARSNSSLALDSATSADEEEEGRTLQLVELCKIFLGDTGKRAYTAFLVTYMYGTLWAYSTVFANSFATYVPVFSTLEASYYFYLVVFGCIVVPMSLMEFSEQISVQVALTIFRILMLSLMVTTVWIAQYSDRPDFGPDIAVYTDEGSAEFDPSKLYLLLPIASYAYIFHHSIPALSAPIEDKLMLPKVFGAALAICFIGYVLLASVVAEYFGPYALPSSNLNWEHYTGVLNEDGSVPAYASIIAFFVILFPALDVASAFPLNAFSLGNNMMSSYYGSRVKDFENSRFHVNLFRSLAAVPPIFAAAVVSDLSNITGYTGLCGFGICFIFPPLLAYYSRKRLAHLGLEADTPYDHYLTTFPFQVALCVTGVVLFIVVGIFQVTDTAVGGAEARRRLMWGGEES